jgi:hypothetical protein
MHKDTCKECREMLDGLPARLVSLEEEVRVLRAQTVFIGIATAKARQLAETVAAAIRLRRR